MGLKAPPRRSLVIAVTFALSVFILTLVVWRTFGGATPFQPQGYRLHADFVQGSQLTAQSDVRIAGVSVGKVVSVTPAEGHTSAVIQLGSAYAPLHADAHAILRSKTLLGETYVELTPGTPGSSWLRDGGTLPASQIEDTQQVDQVLGSFDAPTRASLRRFLTSLATSLRGRGADLNSALGNLQPFTSDSATLLSVLDAQRAEVSVLVHDSGVALDALSARQADLVGLVGAGDQVLSATAARDRSLTATLDALPGFLGSLRGALVALDGAAHDAAPALHALRPVAGLLAPALRAGDRLAPALDQTVVSLGRLVPLGLRGLPALTRLLRATHPLLDTLSAAGSQLVPVLQLVDLYRHELVSAQANLAASTQASTIGARGQVQHYLRVLSPLSNEIVAGYPQRLGSNRYNPYWAPGAYAVGFSHGGLRAFDCRNAGNATSTPPIGSGPPPCLVQAPWRFGGVTRAFPHVEALRP